MNIIIFQSTLFNLIIINIAIMLTNMLTNIVPPIIKARLTRVEPTY